MLKSACVSVLIGIIVYICTAMIMGRKNANRLPGGALAAGFFYAQPWFIGAIFGLIGHFVAVVVAKKLD